MANTRSRKSYKHPDGYNGWKNRQTWNVALWISNDEPLYRTAVNFMKQHGKKFRGKEYIAFIERGGVADFNDGRSTPDGVHFLSSKISRPEMNRFMRDLIS